MDMDQTSQRTNANESAMTVDFDTPASYALGLLTPYDKLPGPPELVPPSPSPGVDFLPFPVSQAGAAAYPAATVHPPPLLLNPHEIAFQQQHYRQQQHQEEELQAFWAGQLAEAEQQTTAAELKVHSLPLARIKKIMKADRDVKMIAAEVPVVFAKACERFILELTLRAWLHTEGTKRRTLQRSDVTAAINSTEAYDFLMDVIPEEEELKGDGVPPPLPTTTTVVPVIVPPSYGQAPLTSVPFAMYANMQPVRYMWATPQHHHQQKSDGGRYQQE